ncbi:Type II secretion system (T2SS), protein F [uncultured archaeon]|nr:Type II secretion system (T2SS), protein F [uncultured archaeon]
MEIQRIHWIGIAVGLGVMLFSLIFMGQSIFFLILGVGIIIAAFPFVFSMIAEGRASAEKEDMFLEFSRNLVESVKAGLPISKSILNVKDKPYGSLTPHVQKLANQIQLGIPLNVALQTFSREVNTKTISRALTLIGQAERAGGDIGEILEAVAGAVSMSDKLKKERKAAISTLVVQGYIIFFVFLIIILVMQFKILPMVQGIANVGTIGSVGTTGAGAATDTGDISGAFFYLLLIQGFFSGLTIGKLAEGSVKAGIKHSFALMMAAFLVSSVAKIVVG